MTSLLHPTGHWQVHSIVSCDQPHLGPFAIPPRRLAAGRREKSEDRLAFLDIIEHDDISWKQIAYAIGNILQCWEHQGSHNAILNTMRMSTTQPSVLSSALLTLTQHRWNSLSVTSTQIRT